ncbi:MAG: rhodanese-like domain-containing protein [Alphaproteobacteria bacterium]|nr:rhodanese-like domain-containing protein [Alphaproteobacteria bacterium]
MKTITSQEIKKYIDNGVKVAFVEAMQEKYFTEGHLPGAFSIAPEKIKELAPKFLQDKNQTIVTYCANTNCQNSKTAAEALFGLGYKNVVVYAGGKEDWKKSGFKFEGNVSNGDVKTGACGTKKSGGSCS